MKVGKYCLEGTGGIKRMEDEKSMPVGRGRIYNGGLGSPKVQFHYTNDIPDDMIAWFNERKNPVTEVYDKAGRPTKVASEVPTFSGYAAKIGISRKTLEEWKKSHKGFNVAYEACRETGKTACYLILASVPGSFKGIEMILKYEFGVGMEGGVAEMTTVMLCGPGQKPSDLVDVVEEVDESEYDDVKETNCSAKQEETTDERV